MDPNLPVDIKLSTLMVSFLLFTILSKFPFADWLQTCRYLKHDWAQNVKDIHAKMAEEIQVNYIFSAFYHCFVGRM